MSCYRALLVMLVLSLAQPCLAESSDASTEIFKQRAIEILKREDSLAAIEYVASIDQPALVVQVFMAAARSLYWDEKAVAAAMAIGRAGIQYALVEAIRTDDENVAVRFRLAAKALAYDLSSFSWPGWNEPGVEITAIDLVHGQDLAKVNLRLARELNRGDEPMSRAHWLVGAHDLPLGQYESARRSFVDAARFATAAEDRPLELLNRGYIYLSEQLMEPRNEALRAEFDFVLAKLSEVGDEGQSYRQQLETAWEVFVNKDKNQDLSQNP